MIEEINFETYLSISSNKFGIYLLENKNSKNLYNKEIILKNNENIIDLNTLIKFLDDNIFKIEKLVGKFVNNIFVVINNYEILNLKFGLKKKNYGKSINKKFLENVIIDAKDLFNENYPNFDIIHMIINKYIYNENIYFSYKEEQISDHLCIEVEFKYISKKFISELDKVLGKYQIKVLKYYDGNYIQDFFKHENLEYSKILSKIQNGFNENEVELVPKSQKKRGFFEKFFQLFS